MYFLCTSGSIAYVLFVFFFFFFKQKTAYEMRISDWSSDVCSSDLKGFSANLSDLLEDLRARDLRDRSRVHAPLVAAADAVIVDSSHTGVKETVKIVLDRWSARVSG